MSRCQPGVPHLKTNRFHRTSPEYRVSALGQVIIFRNGGKYVKICDICCRCFYELSIYKICVASEKILENIARFLAKYWSDENGTQPRALTDLSFTPWYEFWCVEILQFLKHLDISSLIGKFTAISKRSKFPHFHIFSENHLTGEMYLRVSFITPNTIFSSKCEINGCILGNTEGHFKGALTP